MRGSRNGPASRPLVRRVAVVGLLVALVVFPAPGVEGHVESSWWKYNGWGGWHADHEIEVPWSGTMVEPDHDSRPGVWGMSVVTSKVQGDCFPEPTWLNTAPEEDDWCRLAGTIFEFTDLSEVDGPLHLGLSQPDYYDSSLFYYPSPILVCTDVDLDDVYCETDGDGGPVEVAEGLCLDGEDQYWDEGRLHLPHHKRVAIFHGTLYYQDYCWHRGPVKPFEIEIHSRDAPIRPVEGVAVTEDEGYLGRKVNETIEDRRSKACNEEGLTAGERCDIWEITQDTWGCGYPAEEAPEDAKELVEVLLGEVPKIVRNAINESSDRAHEAKCQVRNATQEAI